jgi:hypothetical protein
MRIERAARPYSIGVVVVVLRPRRRLEQQPWTTSGALDRPGGDRRARRCPPATGARAAAHLITALPGRSLAMSPRLSDQLIGGPTVRAQCRAPMAAISAGSGGSCNRAK